MKTIEQIVEEQKQVDTGVNQRSKTASLLKAITLDAKQFFTDLFTGLANKITKNKFDVEVKNPTKLPEVFKVDGSVSVKDTKALLIGLNEIVKGIEAVESGYVNQTKQLEKSLKPLPVDFSKLEQAVKKIEMPAPLKEVSVDNLKDYTKQLDLIKSEIAKLKLDPKIEVKTTPKVSIDLEGVKSRLEAIVAALGHKEEEMVGLSWNKDENGNVDEIIETYPSGKVVSTGWNLGRVKVRDERTG